jgi:LmbE family N-acetylglucosaminyl deacetylase
MKARRPRMVGCWARLDDQHTARPVEWKHSRWGLTDMDAVRDQRQSEDSGAATILRVQTRWLGIPDAIYRGDRHVSDHDLYGSVQPAEQPLANLIAQELADCLGPPRYVPIATTFDRRLDAIQRYATQVPVVFRFTRDVRGAVWDFSRRLAPDLGPVERFWPVLPETDG